MTSSFQISPDFDREDVEDWTVFVNGLAAGEPGGITVDVGPLAIRPNHTTRDGYPMEVLFEPDLGWLVAVDTTPP